MLIGQLGCMVIWGNSRSHNLHSQKQPVIMACQSRNWAWEAREGDNKLTSVKSQWEICYPCEVTTLCQCFNINGLPNMKACRPITHMNAQQLHHWFSWPKAVLAYESVWWWHWLQENVLLNTEKKCGNQSIWWQTCPNFIGLPVITFNTDNCTTGYSGN